MDLSKIKSPSKRSFHLLTHSTLCGLVPCMSYHDGHSAKIRLLTSSLLAFIQLCIGIHTCVQILQLPSTEQKKIVRIAQSGSLLHDTLMKILADTIYGHLDSKAV